MPILGAPGAGVSGADSGVAPSVPSHGTYRWSWVSASGEPLPLSYTPGSAVMVPRDAVVGHMAAPVEVFSSSLSGLDGAVYRGVRYLPREVGMRLRLLASTSTQWHDTVDTLGRVFDTAGGDGLLLAARGDGQVRALRCRYIAGLESPESGDPGVRMTGVFVVQLRAFDPWWYGEPQTLVFQQQTVAPFLPGPPFEVMPTELAGSPTVITNPGGVASWPTWTVTGPASSATFTSGSRTFTLRLSLGEGETVTVDCDPRVPVGTTIRDGSGANLWGVVSDDYPDLWPVPAGESTVVAALGGASEASRITMSFNPRFRSP